MGVSGLRGGERSKGKRGERGSNEVIEKIKGPPSTNNNSFEL